MSATSPRWRSQAIGQPSKIGSLASAHRRALPWLAAISAVVLAALLVYGALAGASAWQERSARERYAGRYVNADGDRLVLRADGTFRWSRGAAGTTGPSADAGWSFPNLSPWEAPDRLFVPTGAESGSDFLVRGSTLVLLRGGTPSSDPTDVWVKVVAAPAE